MEVTRFGGRGKYTAGHIQLWLKVGLIASLAHFHVVKTKVSYRILLGRPWLHKHRLVPSTYHQCMKGRLNGRMIQIAANPSPFEHSNHEAISHNGGIKELSGKGFQHSEVHPWFSINHLSFYKITQKRIRLSKATADYDKPPFGTIPNLQKAIATLFGLKPIYHRCFDSPGR